jgi:N-acetylmuramoyl-L-alanine amidase
MKRIYISPSTQENNAGFSPFTVEEVEMNKIADYLIPLLAKDGRFITKRNFTGMDPYQCAADSNSFLADLHIAIHSNAGGGQGTEVFTFGAGSNSEKLGKALYNQIAPLSPGSDRGVKYNPKLIEVGNSVHATSCLIELDFHDSQAGAEWIARNHDVIATALYKGLCDYLGYKYLALDFAPVIQPPVTSDHDIYLSVRCYESKAEQAIKDINKLGFAAKKLELA